jgi:hypothetical protein
MLNFQAFDKFRLLAVIFNRRQQKKLEKARPIMGPNFLKYKPYKRIVKPGKSW